MTGIAKSEQIVLGFTFHVPRFPFHQESNVGQVILWDRLDANFFDLGCNVWLCRADARADL